MVVDASRSARPFGAELRHEDPDGRGRGGNKWPGRQGEIRRRGKPQFDDKMEIMKVMHYPLMISDGDHKGT